MAAAVRINRVIRKEEAPDGRNRPSTRVRDHRLRRTLDFVVLPGCDVSMATLDQAIDGHAVRCDRQATHR